MRGNYEGDEKTMLGVCVCVVFKSVCGGRGIMVVLPWFLGVFLVCFFLILISL